MGNPRRLIPMNRTPFSSELAGLPEEISAELEDHLMESLGAEVRSGIPLDDARESALRSLGNPRDISRQCLSELDPQRRRGNPLGLQQRFAIAGWHVLGMGFASRVCAASDPSHVAIAICVGLSIGSFTVALLLRRARLPMQWFGGAVSILFAAVSIVVLLQPQWQTWIQGSLALSPAILGVFALFGGVSTLAFAPAFRRSMTVR